MMGPVAAYFSQTFYHQSILPMLLLTASLAYLARPSTRLELPIGFAEFRLKYLGVWTMSVAADWLQGPYVYALYSAYGFAGQEIAQLFVAGFAAALLSSCFVGSIADRFGRKRCCMAYCVLYILSCMTKHYRSYGILMVGRVTGGMATSVLFSCFECWMVSEHTVRHGFSQELLSYLFGIKFTLMYCVAIIAGILAQAGADNFNFQAFSKDSIFYVGGALIPFDMSIAFLTAGLVLIGVIWDENYGDGKQASLGETLNSIQEAAQLFVANKRFVCLSLLVACFEGSMYAFVFNWTPALESEEVPPPHGIIFALFMMACMSGASTSTLVSDYLSPHQLLMVVCCLSSFSFVIASTTVWGGSTTSLKAILASFLLFEFCVGAYFPSLGVIKSEIVPEAIRGTMYNIFRVPLNAVVVGLLLSHISWMTCFHICAGLLAAATVATYTFSAGSSGMVPTESTPLKQDAAKQKSVRWFDEDREGGYAASGAGGNGGHERASYGRESEGHEFGVAPKQV